MLNLPRHTVPRHTVPRHTVPRYTVPTHSAKTLYSKPNLLKNTFGFTLIEIVVVIAIVAVLASVGIPAIAGQVRKSQEAMAVTNAKLIVTTASKMFADLEATGEEYRDPSNESVMREAGISTGMCYIYIDNIMDPTDPRKQIGREVYGAEYISANNKIIGKFSKR